MKYAEKKWRVYLKPYLLGAMAIFAFVLAIKLFDMPESSIATMFNTGVDVTGLFVCTALC